MHLGLFGLLSQQFESKTNVIASMIPALAEGMTVADAFQSASLNGDLVITGDPTFQFNVRIYAVSYTHLRAHET